MMLPYRRTTASAAILLLSLVLAMSLAAQTPINSQGYPDISGEWMEGSDHLVHISQNGGGFTATCTYGNVSWRMEGTVSRDGAVAGRLTHTAGVSQSATGFAQDRRMTLSADRRTLQGQATFVGGGGGHPLTWTRTSALPPGGSYPDISGEWMEGSDHLVHISQNGGGFTATCTYGNVSWRMEGTVSRDGAVAGRLTHTAGVSQSATGFAQDRRMTLSADRRTLQGQATFVGGGGGHPLTWTRTSALPPGGSYPDISGEWMEGSDHLVHISQNGGGFTATCTYGNVSWRMEGTVSRDGAVAGRLTHTAGVSQSATGFAQDRRMTLSADRRTLQGQATFVGGGGGHPLTWTRTSALPPGGSYPDISGEWMEGSDHLVHISQNGGGFTATCTYGNVSWRMEGTVSRDGAVAGRLTHNAGVSQSATGFAQDRRMTLSADRRTLQGQATFVGGGGGHPLTWTRTSAPAW